MKKLLMASLIAGVLLFMPAAEAAIETYTGEGTATSGDNETQAQVVERAKLYAKKNALEQAGVYIQYRATTKDFEFSEDELVAATAGIVKVVGKPKVEKNLLGGDALQVHVELTVEIDTDVLQREMDKMRPKPPIDRPEPVKEPERKIEPVQPKIEEPKPEEPKIEKIEKIEPTIPEPPTPPIPNPVVTTDAKAMTDRLFDLINAERAKVGKAPFTRDPILAQGAKTRVKELTRKWSHKRPDGSDWWSVFPPSVQQRSLWEYIHGGYDSPEKVIKWYSEQTDSKILSGSFQKIGIAYINDPNSDEEHFWIVILG